MVTTIPVNVSAFAVQKKQVYVVHYYCSCFIIYHLMILRNGFSVGNAVIIILQVLP